MFPGLEGFSSHAQNAADNTIIKCSRFWNVNASSYKVPISINISCTISQLEVNI